MEQNQTIDEVFDNATMQQDNNNQVPQWAINMQARMEQLAQHVNGLPGAAPQTTNIVLPEPLKTFDGKDKDYRFTNWLDDWSDLATDFGWDVASAHRRACRALSGPIRDRVRNVVLDDTETLATLKQKYVQAYYGDQKDYRAFQQMIFNYQQEEEETLDAYKRRIERIYSTTLPGWKSCPKENFLVARMFCIGIRDQMLFASAVPEEFKTIDEAHTFCKSKARVGDALRAGFQHIKTPLQMDVKTEALPMEIDTVGKGSCYNCGRTGHMKRDCRAPKKRQQNKEQQQGNRQRNKEGQQRNKDGGRQGQRRGKAYYKKKLAELSEKYTDLENRTRTETGHQSSDESSDDYSEDERGNSGRNQDFQ